MTYGDIVYTVFGLLIIADRVLDDALSFYMWGYWYFLLMLLDIVLASIYCMSLIFSIRYHTLVFGYTGKCAISELLHQIKKYYVGFSIVGWAYFIEIMIHFAGGIIYRYLNSSIQWDQVIIGTPPPDYADADDDHDDEEPIAHTHSG
jgi:hypothetical protein